VRDVMGYANKCFGFRVGGLSAEGEPVGADFGS
jgi:hypothetical protein